MKNYYPKSQIKAELHTNGGELYTKNGGAEYIGLYHEVAGERYFTGPDANSTPTRELVKLNLQTQVYSTGIIPKKGTNSNQPINYNGDNEWSQEYIQLNEITRQDDLNTVPLLPQSYFPIVTEEDYLVGEFERFFVKRMNYNQYIEISPSDFDLYKQYSPLVHWEIYEPFSIPWEIKGQISKVRSINQNTIKRTERNRKISGFQNYFKSKYTQFFKYATGENQYTDGTEFKIKSTNEIYKGFYHVHPEKGPMVGAQHIPTQHDFLIPIEQINTISSTPSDLRFVITGSIPSENISYGDDVAVGGGSSGY